MNREELVEKMAEAEFSELHPERSGSGWADEDEDTKQYFRRACSAALRVAENEFERRIKVTADALKGVRG